MSEADCRNGPIHHTFYATGKASCGRPLATLAQRYTGLDSRVTCPGCLIELRRYREDFPLASNGVVAVEIGDRMTFIPENVGGAR